MEDLTEVFKPVKDLLLDLPLKDKDLMTTENPVSLHAGKTWPITLSDLTLSFGADARAEVLLFNDAADKDPDNFLGLSDTPIICNTEKNACLKYSNAVTVSAKGQGSLAAIGFSADLSATGNVRTLFYRQHNNNQKIREAFLEDITHYKTIFNFADIEALAAGDALAFLVNGNLNCSLKVSWSNIFSQSLQSLTSELPFPLTLDLNLSPALTAAFDVSVTDDFAYFITKQPDGRCLVSINKKKNTSRSASAGASIGVGFAKPDELTGQVNAIYGKLVQSLFGHALEEIDAAIAAIKEAVADAAQQTLISKLLNIFKLQDLPASIDTLADKFKKMQQEVPANLKKIAQANITLSFTYQYRRIEENKELLSGIIAVSDLKNFHGDLLRFRPARMLDAIRAGSIPFQLNSYLSEKTLTISRSWGLGLRVLDLSLLGQDYVESKWVVATNISGARQVTIDKTAGYKWEMGKSNGSWMGEWVAAMPAFSQAPALNEFHYSLVLNTVLHDPAIDSTDLRDYLDFALLWGAIRQEDIQTLVTKYTSPPASLIGKEGLVETRLSFPETVLPILIARISDNKWNTLNQDYLCRALGAAMSYLPDHSLRAGPGVREKTYAGLWKDFLNDHQQDIADYAANAAAAIGDGADPDHLAAFEADQANWTFGDSFAGVIRSNPNLYETFRDLIRGLGDWQTGIVGHAPYTTFNDVLTNICGVFSQRFYLRTLGYFLLLHATGAGIEKDIKKTCTITIGTGDTAQAINFSVIR